ncbi:sulfate ABC transporter substrate-binding protein [Paenibacillus sp. 481]|uniref:sulfate ABC transporter substrate-binding protein n=1 Tax=Paenibacillus sp. 481 TaxID=2835869 RepID=UPI001E3A029E|nr:sulfate ABC transporter substrate-binding protein [Paenibacillus sp. 481]UHA72092.1 sulfate ABC transporter substrate-binding protein [Paenibacillus sp. 481]
MKQGWSNRAFGIISATLCMIMLALSGCSSTASTGDPASPVVAQAEATSGESVTLVIGAYTVAKDALERIIPQFQAHWKEQTGQTVHFQQSYEASGTQARSIAGGMEADVAVFAMEGDVDKLVKANLVPQTWKSKDAYNGMVTSSIVVIGTRKDNPLGIKEWEDLTKPGVDVLYPNPRTSGGAQWDINAIYGAGLKLAAEKGVDGPQYAKRLLMNIHNNVISLDKSGRASMAAFEYGVGDAIVTYENELLSRISQGVPYEIVVPKHTIRIENPALVVDAYAKKHGTEKVAQAFVDYLRSEQAQRLWMEAGFRPVNKEVAAALPQAKADPEGLFTIEDMGGWDEVRKTIYSKKGIWYQVLAGIE